VKELVLVSNFLDLFSHWVILQLLTSEPLDLSTCRHKRTHISKGREESCCPGICLQLHPAQLISIIEPMVSSAFIDDPSCRIFFHIGKTSELLDVIRLGFLAPLIQSGAHALPLVNVLEVFGNLLVIASNQIKSSIRDSLSDKLWRSPDQAVAALDMVVQEVERLVLDHGIDPEGYFS